MKTVLLASAALLSQLSSALAMTAVLTWANPIVNADGTPLSSPITSVTIQDNGTMVATMQGAPTTYTSGILSSGTHQFAVIVTNAGGSSVPTNFMPVTVIGPPGPATGPIIVLQP